MKPVQTYVRVISAILLAVIGWGVVAPPLVSSPTDIGLVVGILIVFAVPACIYVILKPIIKQLKENEEK